MKKKRHIILRVLLPFIIFVAISVILRRGRFYQAVQREDESLYYEEFGGLPVAP